MKVAKHMGSTVPPPPDRVRHGHLWDTHMHSFYRMVIMVLVILYVVLGLAIVSHRARTRCPGGNLALCQEKFSGGEDCGSLTLSGTGDCSRFVRTEECICRKCRACLSSSHKPHCETSSEQKMRMCVEGSEAP